MKLTVHLIQQNLQCTPVVVYYMPLHTVLIICMCSIEASKKLNLVQYPDNLNVKGKLQY